MSRGGRARRRRPQPSTPSAAERARATTDELLRRAAGEGGESAEPWTWLALLQVALLVALALYLGARPGGVGPVLAYSYGPTALGLCALATFLGGGLWAATHRPFFQRRRMAAFVAIGLTMMASSYSMPYPSSHEGNPSSVRFELPVDGEWRVRWGGESVRPRGCVMAPSPLQTNALVILPDRRFGLDLVRDREGGAGDRAPTRLEDYPAFGQLVRAPSDGDVVAVHDGEPDHLPGVFGVGEHYGNHVVLRVAPGEYAILSNLQCGSLAVGEGDLVDAGAPIARVGNSGRSSATPEPHLALHLQDTPHLRRAEAIPWRFYGYETEREPGRWTRVEGASPRGGVAGERVRRVE